MPPINALEYIKEVSNDPADIGRFQLLTAEAIEGKIPAAPSIITFDNSDLVNGVLTQPYVSGQPIVMYSMKDENNEDISVPTVYDNAGTYVSFDFSSLEDPDNLGSYITGIWTVAIWTSTGPVGVPQAPPTAPETATGRVRLEPAIGDINLKALGNYTIYTVEADKFFMPEEIEIFLTEADNVVTPASISLQIVAGDVILSSTVLPITLQYQRFALDISGSDVLPAGAVIEISVTDVGVATGNMIGRAYLFGYLDDVVI